MNIGMIPVCYHYPINLIIHYQNENVDTGLDSNNKLYSFFTHILIDVSYTDICLHTSIHLTCICPS